MPVHHLCPSSRWWPCKTVLKAVTITASLSFRVPLTSRVSADFADGLHLTSWCDAGPWKAVPVRNPKVHCRANKRLPQDPTFSHLNSVHSFTPYIFNLLSLAISLPKLFMHASVPQRLQYFLSHMILVYLIVLIIIIRPLLRAGGPSARGKATGARISQILHYSYRESCCNHYVNLLTHNHHHHHHHHHHAT
jgi:hypothetical protein